MILLTDVRELCMDVRSTGAVHVGGHGGVVALLVRVVGGRIFLLLQCDGEAQVAIFLAQAGVVQAGHGGQGEATVGAAAGSDADAIAVVHVHVVGVGGFGFFAHDC